MVLITDFISKQSCWQVTICGQWGHVLERRDACVLRLQRGKKFPSHSKSDLITITNQLLLFKAECFIQMLNNKLATLYVCKKSWVKMDFEAFSFSVCRWFPSVVSLGHLPSLNFWHPSYDRRYALPPSLPRWGSHYWVAPLPHHLPAHPIPPPTTTARGWPVPSPHYMFSPQLQLDVLPSIPSSCNLQNSPLVLHPPTQAASMPPCPSHPPDPTSPGESIQVQTWWSRSRTTATALESMAKPGKQETQTVSVMCVLQSGVKCTSWSGGDAASPLPSWILEQWGEHSRCCASTTASGSAP